MRQRAWRRTLQALRLTPGPVVEGDWSSEGGYHAARKLLEIGSDNFSAIVVGNDQMALGVLRALHEAGIRVPAQVSLVGFDNIPEAAFFDPPLTTIDHDFDAVARYSLEYLIQIIRDPAIPREHKSLAPNWSAGKARRGAGADTLPGWHTKERDPLLHGRDALPRAIRRRLSDNDIRCSASDRGWFPARPAQHVHRRRNNGKGRIQNDKWRVEDVQRRTRRSASAIQGAARDTCANASRSATPDAGAPLKHSRSQEA